jgi:hypothetical protein
MCDHMKVARDTRPKAITSGDSSGTANLTKKYGSPQIIQSAANAIQLRQLNVFLQRSSYPGSGIGAAL